MPELRQKSPCVKFCELFADIPRSIHEDILAGAVPREYQGGEMIFRTGDLVSEVLALTHGRAKITQVDKNGTEVILRLVVPGEILGNPILEKGDVYSSTAQTLHVCRVIAWDRATFDALLDGVPVLLRNATHIVARQLFELQTRFCELSTERTAPRLAGAVLRLIGQIGRRQSESEEINVTQQVLAGMIATDVYTVNRVLSRWERQGLVSVRRRALVIQNHKGLLDIQKGV